MPELAALEREIALLRIENDDLRKLNDSLMGSVARHRTELMLKDSLRPVRSVQDERTLALMPLLLGG